MIKGMEEAGKNGVINVQNAEDTSSGSGPQIKLAAGNTSDQTSTADSIKDSTPMQTISSL